jgi:hypothetical protein
VPGPRILPPSSGGKATLRKIAAHRDGAIASGGDPAANRGLTGEASRPAPR